MRKTNLIITAYFFILTGLFASPYFGGYFVTDNEINMFSFKTDNTTAFYIDIPFNKWIRFYTRVSAGFSYDARFAGSNSIDNFAFRPAVELLFFEFRTGSDRGVSHSKSLLFDNNGKNFDTFKLRIGRVNCSSSGLFYFDEAGDGIIAEYSVGNFNVNVSGITNSFDYLPMFDYSGSEADIIFTRWDRKRLTSIFNINKDSVYVADTDNPSYNFYFKQGISDDYSSSDIAYMNDLRQKATVAGRVFPSVTVSIENVYYQNFTLNFTSNIDLIPQPLVLTHPSLIDDINNTFAGRYNSFYLGFKVHGRVIRGLYYKFDIVYETGTNATAYSTGTIIKYEDRLINSFACNTGVDYFFDSLLRPAAAVTFSYSHGDPDAAYPDRTIVNKFDDDNGFRGVTNNYTGFVIAPDFTNVMILGFKGSILPLGFIDDVSLSRFNIRNEVLVFMRPVVKGAGIYTEKTEFLSGGELYDSSDKFYLGTEINTAAGFQVFSDFGFEFKGGVFVPNFVICHSDSVFWKIGFNANLSF